MSCVELKKRPNALRIILTPTGRDELGGRLDNGDQIGADDVLHDLLSDHLENGWSFIQPEEIGALTSAPILSDEFERDDDGELTKVGAVYWYPDYQVLSPTSELLAHGHVDFRRAD